MHDLNSWLLTVIQGIVSSPADIRITSVTDDMGLLFTVEVAKADAGKVIGKEGSTAAALRSLLRSAAYLHRIRASLKINGGTNYSPPRE